MVHFGEIPSMNQMSDPVPRFLFIAFFHLAKAQQAHGLQDQGAERAPFQLILWQHLALSYYANPWAQLHLVFTVLRWYERGRAMRYRTAELPNMLLLVLEKEDYRRR